MAWAGAAEPIPGTLPSLSTGKEKSKCQGRAWKRSSRSLTWRVHDKSHPSLQGRAGFPVLIGQAASSTLPGQRLESFLSLLLHRALGQLQRGCAPSHLALGYRPTPARPHGLPSAPPAHSIPPGWLRSSQRQRDSQGRPQERSHALTLSPADSCTHRPACSLQSFGLSPG